MPQITTSIDTAREIIRLSLDQIASHIGMALHDAGLRFRSSSPSQPVERLSRRLQWCEALHA